MFKCVLEVRGRSLKSGGIEGEEGVLVGKRFEGREGGGRVMLRGWKEWCLEYRYIYYF